MVNVRVEVYNINYTEPKCIRQIFRIMLRTRFCTIVKYYQFRIGQFHLHGSINRSLGQEFFVQSCTCEIIREESLARGRQEGIEQAVRVLKGVLPPEVIAERFELPLEDVLRILAV